MVRLCVVLFALVFCTASLLVLEWLLFGGLFVSTSRAWFRLASPSPSQSPLPVGHESTSVAASASASVCSPELSSSCVSVVNLCPARHNTFNFSGESGWRRVRITQDFALILYEVDYSLLSGVLSLLLVPEPLVPTKQYHHAGYSHLLDEMLYFGDLTCQLTTTTTTTTTETTTTKTNTKQQQAPRNPFNLELPAVSWTAFELPPMTEPDPDHLKQSSGNTMSVPYTDSSTNADTGTDTGVEYGSGSGSPPTMLVVPAVFDEWRSRYVECSLPIPVPLSPTYRLQLVYRSNASFGADSGTGKNHGQSGFAPHTAEDIAQAAKDTKVSMARSESPWPGSSSSVEGDAGHGGGRGGGGGDEGVFSVWSSRMGESRFGVPLSSRWNGGRKPTRRFHDFKLDMQLCHTHKHAQQFGVCYTRGYRDAERRVGHESAPADVMDWLQYHRLLGVGQAFMYDRYGDFREPFRTLTRTQTQTQAQGRVDGLSSSSSPPSPSPAPSSGLPFVVYFPFPPLLHASDLKYYSQILAVHLCALHSLHTVHWLLQMDSDEYLVIHPNNIAEHTTYYYNHSTQTTNKPKHNNNNKATPSNQQRVPAQAQALSQGHIPPLAESVYPFSAIDYGGEVPLVPICPQAQSQSQSQSGVWVSSLSGCVSALSAVFGRYSHYGIVNLARYPVGDGMLWPRPVASLTDPNHPGHVSLVYRYTMRIGECAPQIGPPPDTPCLNGKYVFQPRGLLKANVHWATHVLVGPPGAGSEYGLPAQDVPIRVHHYEYAVEERYGFGPVASHAREPNKFKTLINDTSTMRIMYLAHTHVDRNTFHIRTHK